MNQLCGQQHLRSANIAECRVGSKYRTGMLRRQILLIKISLFFWLFIAPSANANPPQPIQKVTYHKCKLSNGKIETLPGIPVPISVNMRCWVTWTFTPYCGIGLHNKCEQKGILFSSNIDGHPGPILKQWIEITKDGNPFWAQGWVNPHCSTCSDTEFIVFFIKQTNGDWTPIEPKLYQGFPITNNPFASWFFQVGSQLDSDNHVTLIYSQINFGRP